MQYLGSRWRNSDVYGTCANQYVHVAEYLSTTLGYIVGSRLALCVIACRVGLFLLSAVVNIVNATVAANS